MVDDVINGTLIAGITEAAIGEVINIASEEENTVKEIAEIIANITNSPSKIVHLESLKGDPRRPRGRRGPIETALWWCASDEKCEPETHQKI